MRGYLFVFTSLFLVCLLLTVATYAYLSGERQDAVQSVLNRADAYRSGDPIESLISYFHATTEMYEKNRVIWALGELRDDRALPTLTVLLVSHKCDHARYVCQNEVRKAIKKINGEVPDPFAWQRIADV